MARNRWPCFFLNARRRRDCARDLYSCQRTNMIVEFRSVPKRARAAYLVHYMEIASASELWTVDIGDRVGDVLPVARSSLRTLFDLDAVCSASGESVDDVLQ